MSNSKEYNARYWKEHKEKISEKKKKRYREDAGYRESCKERNKRWVENNRERWNEYMRERRKKNVQKSADNSEAEKGTST